MKQFCLLWMFAAILTAGADDGVAVHYDFNTGEGTELKAVTGGKDGRIFNFGEHCKWVDGASGKALEFPAPPKSRNQCGGVIIPNFKFDFTKPFTIIMTIHLQGPVSSGMREMIGWYDAERGPGFRFSVFYGSLELRTGDDKQVKTISTNNAAVAIPAERWIQLAVTYDGTNGAIYLEGKRVAEKAITITLPQNKALKIGAYQGRTAYSMQGAIDDLKIYDRAFSPEEIASLYLENMK